MKLVIVYKPQSDHARSVDEFVHNFSGLHPSIEVQLIDADSAEAETILKAYDIVRYPTLLAISDDGKMQNMWSGSDLPMMDELFGYLNS